MVDIVCTRKGMLLLLGLRMVAHPFPFILWPLKVQSWECFNAFKDSKGSGIDGVWLEKSNTSPLFSNRRDDRRRKEFTKRMSLKCVWYCNTSFLF